MMNYLKPYENILNNEKGERAGDIIKLVNLHLFYHFFPIFKMKLKFNFLFLFLFDY